MSVTDSTDQSSCSTCPPTGPATPYSPSQASSSKGSVHPITPASPQEDHQDFSGFGESQQTVFSYEPASIASYLSTQASSFRNDQRRSFSPRNWTQQDFLGNSNRNYTRDYNGTSNWIQERGAAREVQVMDAEHLNLENKDYMPIEELEEKFKDFKLKPKVLTGDRAVDERKSRVKTRKPSCMQCAFCMSNGEAEHVYRSHVLKDPEGRVTCPVLYMYNCPICRNGGGPRAHTVKYCPKNRPYLRKRSFPRTRLDSNGPHMF